MFGNKNTETSLVISGLSCVWSADTKPLLVSRMEFGSVHIFKGVMLQPSSGSVPFSVVSDSHLHLCWMILLQKWILLLALIRLCLQWKKKHDTNANSANLYDTGNLSICISYSYMTQSSSMDLCMNNDAFSWITSTLVQFRCTLVLFCVSLHCVRAENQNLQWPRRIKDGSAPQRCGAPLPLWKWRVFRG